ncbi:hypothetical protein CC2G_014532 [Coprinopsis cinerea AmutBmut pab1-1]|nr:hypothetical protein CC2G_014532 [Coprinopsis cinerea AmutBmut pab1-1]
MSDSNNSNPSTSTQTPSQPPAPGRCPQAEVLRTRELCDFIIQHLQTFNLGHKRVQLPAKKRRKKDAPPPSSQYTWVPTNEQDEANFRAKNLMSASFVTRAMHEAGDGLSIFTDMLAEDNIGNFLAYASRVRSVTLDAEKWTISPQVYMEFSRFIGQNQSQIFPKLRTLKITDFTESANSIIHLLLFDSVTNLQITAPLKLRNPFVSPMFSKLSASSALQTVQHLRHLVLRPCSPTSGLRLLQNLNLTNLSTLQLQFSEHPGTLGSIAQLLVTHAKSLVQLRISTTTTVSARYPGARPEWKHLVDFGRIASLEVLSIKVPSWTPCGTRAENRQVFKRFMQNLSSSTSLHTLELPFVFHAEYDWRSRH